MPPTIAVPRIRESASSGNDVPTTAGARYAPRPIGPRARRKRVSGRSIATGPHRRKRRCRSGAWRACETAARDRARGERVSARALALAAFTSPLAPVRRDGFEMDKLGENGSRRFRSPASQSRIAVGRIAHQRQVVGDRRRRDTPNFWITPASSMVTRVRRFSWTMRVPRTHCARSLSGVQMITRSTRAIPSGRHRPGSQRIVRLKFHHRPDDNAGRREHVFEQWELRQQVGFNAFAGLVTRPQSVAKRFDDVIGRNGDVRGAALDHAQHRGEDASDRGHFAAVLIPRGRQRVVVPEQLVCAVDQIDVQGATPTQPYRTGTGSINFLNGSRLSPSGPMFSCLPPLRSSLGRGGHIADK